MKINQPAQYLDHLMRQTRMHHVQLSSMADLKANMVLTMSSLVVTFSAPHLLNPDFRWPALVLVCFSMATIFFAAYAVMPKTGASSRLPPPDIKDPGFNLLFFGDFTRMSYEDFEKSMNEVMNDPSLTYEAQVREIYTLGVFLSKKKYRFLRYAYVTFLLGILSSGALYFIIFMKGLL